MPTNVSNLWTDERIDATVTREFVAAQLLLPKEQELLHTALSFGDGLTDDTYLDWILTRAKRLFLILVEIKIPDQIFGLVDESYDDADLPIALDAVRILRLSEDPDRSLDRKFYRAQFRFLIRTVKEGEHVRYTAIETIPVEPVGLKSGIVPLGKDGLDKVRLASSYPEVYARKRVVLGQAGDVPSETDVLSEVSFLKKLIHPHLASVYGSYLDGDSVYVLLTPAAEYSLKSFITDTPKHFESLPKRERREILVNWPHCLANAMDWLHSKGLNHGAVCPSNIHISSSYAIFLGQHKSYSLTYNNTKLDKVEAYQYASPERWKRAATVQTSGPGKVALPSGGRTARKQSESKDSASIISPAKHRLSWGTTTKSTSTRASVDTATPTLTIQTFEPFPQAESVRPQSERSNAKPSPSLLSSSSSGSKKTSTTDRTKIPSVRPSLVMSDTSGDGNTVRGLFREPVILAPPEVRTTIVQTWHSTQIDPLPADMFALGAIIIDILTFICDKSAGAFTRFRSAKNRTAGRGGGLADASFHANLGQVEIWTTSLIKDVKKKAKKDDGQAYKAVEPMIELTKLCLERDPDDRIKADEFEKQIAQCLIKSAGFSKLHCYRTFQATADVHSDNPSFTQVLHGRDISTASTSDNHTDSTVPARMPIQKRSKISKIRKNSTEDLSPTALQSSYSSLSSFNFEDDFGEYVDDLDIENSLSIDDDDYDDNWLYRKDVIDLPSFGDPLGPGFPKPSALPERHYSGDSRIDPSVIISSADRGHSPIKTFLLPESRPGSMPPLDTLQISDPTVGGISAGEISAGRFVGAEEVANAKTSPVAMDSLLRTSSTQTNSGWNTRLNRDPPSSGQMQDPFRARARQGSAANSAPANAVEGNVDGNLRPKANFSRLQRSRAGV